MQGPLSKKLEQPQVNENDESFEVGVSFTQPSFIQEYTHLKEYQAEQERLSQTSNAAESIHIYSNNESPKSNSFVGNDNDPGFESESNRSSKVFERSQTERIKLKDGQQQNSELIRVSSIKDLLRLFRVNLNDDNTFEHNGSKYMIDIFDFDVPSPGDGIPFKKTGEFARIEEKISPIVLFEKIQIQQMRQEEQQRAPDLNFVANAIHSNLKPTEELQTSFQQDLNKVNSALSQENVGQIEILPFIEEELKIELIDDSSSSEEEVQEEEGEQEDMDYKIIQKQKALEIAIEFEPEDQEQIDKLTQELKELEEAKNNKGKKQGKKGKRQVDERDSLEIAAQTVKTQNTVHNSSSQPLIAGHHKTLTDSIQSADTFLLSRDSMQTVAHESKYRRVNTVGGKNQDPYHKLTQVHIEKEKLMQKIAQYELKLQNLNNLFVGGERNVADAQLHLAFLFATPLVIRKSGFKGQNNKEHFTTMPLLEFKKEFKEIKESLIETKRSIRVKSMQATIENLTMMLGQNPLALHFSGHGIENNEKNFGRQYKVRQNEGNYLLFETEDGEGDLVSEKQLHEFITSSNTNLEFVFVASCYSEFAGRIFLNAGAKHVICVRSGNEIADQAVITFSKAFYHSVFSQGMTICQSFELAQNQVKAKFGSGESNKFDILKRPDESAQKSKYPGMADLLSDQKKPAEHKCKIFGPLNKGEVQFMDIIPRFTEFPSKVDNFIGRQKELYEVIHTVLNNRLVNIIGLPGIGKTSLCKNAVHYIADRKLFKLGIVFMQLKGYMDCELFLKKLVLNFVLQNFDMDQEKQQRVKNFNSDQFFQFAVLWLRAQEDKVLIVFDNAEDLLYYDKQSFRTLVNDMIVSCPNLHILLTSRITLGALQDVTEKILVLQELSSFFTVELFISRSREIEQDEIKELLVCQPENYLLVGETQSQNKKVTNLSEHHLFKILGGNPHAIILAAPLLIKLSLKQLYLTLNSKEMHEILKVDGIQDSTVASLRLSLEASIKVLEKEDTQSLKFFFLIGMLPGGIYEEELGEIWGSDYMKHVERLMNLSLISKKEGHGEKTKIMLPPFMVNYAEAKIDYEDKEVFNEDLSIYYAKICKEIYEVNGKAYKSQMADKQSELTHQLVERLLKHESNIWACFYRMVDMKPIQQEEIIFDYEDLNLDMKKVRRFSTLDPHQLKNLRMNTMKNPQKLSISINDLSQTAPIKKNTLELTGKIPSKGHDGDTTDRRPFEVNVEDTTPRNEELNVVFGRKTKNVEKSLLLPQATIRYINEGSDDEKQGDDDRLETEEMKSENSFKEDEHEQDIHLTTEEEQFYEEDGAEDAFQNLHNESKKKSPPGHRETTASVIKPQLSEDQKLNHIIRNSIVNFQRKSSLHQQPLGIVKDIEQEKMILLRRQTIDRGFKSHAFKTFYKKKKKKIDELQESEKLVIYYAMNQYLLHENENCLRLILNYALKWKGSLLYDANIQRILGLIYLHKNEIDQALKAFKLSENYFKGSGSIYGEALTKFSVGFLYRSKLSHFIITTSEDKIFKKAQTKFEQALKLFTEIHHIVGEALCHSQLAHIHQKLSNKHEQKEHQQLYLHMFREYSKMPKKGQCPHIQRVHGMEISLMTEIVQDNENKDLFPQIKQRTFDDSLAKNNTVRAKELSSPSSQRSFNKKKDKDLPFQVLKHQLSAPEDTHNLASLKSEGSPSTSEISSPELKTQKSMEKPEIVRQVSLGQKIFGKITQMISQLEVVQEGEEEDFGEAVQNSRPRIEEDEEEEEEGEEDNESETLSDLDQQQFKKTEEPKREKSPFVKERLQTSKSFETLQHFAKKKQKLMAEDDKDDEQLRDSMDDEDDNEIQQREIGENEEREGEEVKQDQENEIIQYDGINRQPQSQKILKSKAQLL